MSPKFWVKQRFDRVLSLEFDLLSLEAQAVYQKIHALAGKCDMNGLLILNGHLLGTDELFSARVSQRKVKLAVDELCFAGFIQRRGDGTIEVNGWEEEQADPTAGRKRKQRDLDRDFKRDIMCDSHADSHGQESRVLDTSSLVAKAPHSSAPADWIEPMKALVRPLMPKTLERLSPDEVHNLARLHAYRWANCTKSDQRNRAAARRIASGISNLARDRDYKELTVKQYISFGDDAWKRGGQAPMFRVWDVTGAVEKA